MCYNQKDVYVYAGSGYNIDVLMLKNCGYSLNEIIAMLPYESNIIETIFINDTMEIISY
jgi:hypothetical protein